MSFSRNFSVQKRAGTVVVLDAGDDAYNVSQQQAIALLGSECTSLFVYAETIELSSSLELRGKKIGLFCNELILSGNEKVTIDVSGQNGTAARPSTTDDGLKGGNGGDSGSIGIFVQTLDTQFLQRLELKASGGDGGRGGSTTAKSKKGGEGGDGGKPGFISLNFISSATDNLDRFRTSQSGIKGADWTRRAIATAQYVSDNIIEDWLPTFDLYRGVAFAYKRILTAMEAKDTAGIKTAVEALRLILVDASKDKRISDTASDLLKKLDSTNTVFENQNSLSEFNKFASTDLETAISQLAQDVIYSQKDVEKDIRSRLTISSGIGGTGGNSSDGTASNVGGRGLDGPKPIDAVQCGLLSSLPSIKDLEITSPFVHPQQCRLLLNKANRFYFSASQDNVLQAGKLYQRLCRRVSIAEQLATPAGKTSKLVQTYNDSYIKLKLLPSVQGELSNIFADARTKLGRISLGQDMFGQSSDWVPRLSSKFYAQRVADMIGQLRDIETALKTFADMKQLSDASQDQITMVTNKTKTAIDQAQARIKILKSENGPLESTAYKITVFNPIMEEKRKFIKEKVNQVLKEIKSNVDIGLVTDGLTTLASSKNKAEAGKNALVAGYKFYKASNTVTDDEGNTHKKENVIQDLKSCGDTLESLEAVIKTNKDGTINISDPGAMKVLVSAEQLAKLLEQFKNVLPKDMVKKLGTHLDDYMAAIASRNSAVLEYNALLSLEAEFLAEIKYQETQQSSLSSLAINVDYSLPAIVQWLAKLKDDMSFSIMQRLNYQARAIRYWGLVRDLPLESPAPLAGSIDLNSNQEALSKAFEDCLVNLASGVWNTWPNPTNNLGSVLLELSEAELTELKSAKSVAASNNGLPAQKFYSVNINIPTNMPDFQRLGADVRLRQVRFWLPGARVGKASGKSGAPKLLTVHLTHSGDEVVCDHKRSKYFFKHTPVDVVFSYDCTSLTDVEKRSESMVATKQSIENDYQGSGDPTLSSVAPIGPYTMWRICVREDDNPDLDLSDVSAAYLEFWGRSRGFTQSW